MLEDLILNAVIGYCNLIDKAPRVLRKPMVYALLKPVHYLSPEPKESWSELWTSLCKDLDEHAIQTSKLSKVLE